MFVWGDGISRDLGSNDSFELDQMKRALISHLEHHFGDTGQVIGGQLAVIAAKPVAFGEWMTAIFHGYSQDICRQTLNQTQIELYSSMTRAAQVL